MDLPAVLSWIYFVQLNSEKKPLLSGESFITEVHYIVKFSKSKPTLYLVFYFGISQNLDITVSTEAFHYYVIWTVDISID